MLHECRLKVGLAVPVFQPKKLQHEGVVQGLLRRRRLSRLGSRSLCQ